MGLEDIFEAYGLTYDSLVNLLYDLAKITDLKPNRIIDQLDAIYDESEDV